MTALIQFYLDQGFTQQVSLNSWAQSVVIPTVVLPSSGNITSMSVACYALNLGTDTIQNISLQPTAGTGIHGATLASNAQIAPDVVGSPGVFGAPGASVVLVSGSFNPSKLAPAFNTSFPVISNPTVAPTISEVTNQGSNLPAGVYTVGYTFYNVVGETLLSPTSVITIGSNSSIQVNTIGLVPNATNINYYMSPLPSSNLLYYVNTNTGSTLIDLAGVQGYMKFWIQQTVPSTNTAGVYQANITLNGIDIG